MALSVSQVARKPRELHGVSWSKVNDYRSLRRHFATHESACRSLALDPTTFNPTVKEVREFLRGPTYERA